MCPAPAVTTLLRIALLRPAALGVTVLIAACSAVPTPSPPEPRPPAPSPSIVALYQQPAERALLDGIRAYEDATFDKSEAELRSALQTGLASGRDRAMAYKYLAFISCAFGRPAECEADFESAFAADPNFALSDKEIGHPIWGPVYRRVAAEHAH
jgi:hypothetical protein